MTTIHHFGLTREPFAAAPDPTFWYPTLGHADARARVEHALAVSPGLTLLLGGTGYGKSALRASLLHDRRRDALTGQAGRAQAEWQIAALDDPRTCRTDAGLLRAVLARVGLPLDGQAGMTYLRRWTRFLETAHLRGQRVLLAIDDAHTLGGTQLDLLHALLAAAPPGAACFHLVLCAPPVLAERVARRGGLAAHLGTVHLLNPLNRADTGRLIAHRLHIAGLPSGASLFTEDALDALHEATGGVPTALMRLCAACLTEARFLGAHAMDAAVVEAARIGDPLAGVA